MAARRPCSVAKKALPAADFLVIGSGVAGLRAAIGLSRAGRVLILTKGSPAEGSSIYAQGGVAVAPEENDIALHRDDTLRAGKGLCREAAVQVLVEEGPARIQELIRWGARFDRAGEGYAFAYPEPARVWRPNPSPDLTEGQVTLSHKGRGLRRPLEFPPPAADNY